VTNSTVANGVVECRRRWSKGFTLLETLVALLVLSVGLLGSLRLALATTRTHQQAGYRLRAATLASDMVERIRLNRAGRDGYTDGPSNNHCYTDTRQGRSCSPAELAAHDLFEWRREIDASLPDGAGIVVRTARESLPRLLVSVEWRVGKATHRRYLDVAL